VVFTKYTNTYAVQMGNKGLTVSFSYATCCDVYIK